jgi:hypothetical protein
MLTIYVLCYIIIIDYKLWRLRMRRFLYYTLMWCFFPPLFFVGNRVWEIKNSHPLPKLARKGIARRLKRGDVLGAFELFWSRWNPVMTTETTKPLYRLCGGNDRPLFSTAVCFIYSGIFLHWGGCGLAWAQFYIFFTGPAPFPNGYWAMLIYFGFGALVIAAKIFKNVKKTFNPILAE